MGEAGRGGPSRSVSVRVAACALTILLGSALALVMGALQSRQRADHETERSAHEIVDGLRVIDGLEWRAIAGDAPDDLAAAFATQSDVLRAQVSSGRGVTPPTAEAIDVYLRAVDDLLDALAAGDRGRATSIDEERVDPAYDRAIEDTAAVADRARVSAQTAEHRVFVLSILVSLGAGVLVAVGVWLVLGFAMRRAERDRADAEGRRFRSLVHSSPGVFTVIAGDDRLTLMSSTLGILGDLTNATGGGTVAAVVGDEVHEVWRQADQRLRESSVPQRFEVEARSVDGRAVHLEGSGALLDDDPTTRAWVWHDLTERKQLEIQLLHQAFYDSLTGAANRSLLRERVEHALARAHRDGTPTALIFCDLDDFKTINDSLGHGAGDDMLRILTTRLEGCVRGADTLARLGGDEFAILLEGAGTDRAVALAERILDVVAFEIELDGRVVHPSISLGIAGASPGITSDELLRNADTAMYAAKRRGKGCVEVFQDAMHRAATRLLELQRELRVALDQGQLRVVYQPTLSLLDGSVDGIEALVRWDHPTRGVIAPSEFIPVAEQSGLIVPLGAWVLRAAATVAAKVNATRDRPVPVPVHVNLAPQQLRDPHLLDLVTSVLASTGVDPAQLVLEVTEGSLLDDRGAIRRLHELAALGVRIAIDDFGTGYTSISYLQQLPISILKIDRSFVSGDALPPNQRAAFLHAIVSLAHSLGVHCVAEGIEEPGQLEELQLLGCHSGQGYLWSPGIDADQLPGTLERLTDQRAAHPAN